MLIRQSVLFAAAASVHGFAAVLPQQQLQRPLLPRVAGVAMGTEPTAAETIAEAEDGPEIGFYHPPGEDAGIHTSGELGLSAPGTSIAARSKHASSGILPCAPSGEMKRSPETSVSR